MALTTLGFIVEKLGGQLHADPATRVAGLASLDSAGPTDICFAGQAKYREQLSRSPAACVIVGPALKDVALARGACIVSDQPYLYFARLTQLWKREHVAALPATQHPTAVVHPSAHLGQGVHLDAFALVGAGVVLGDGVHLGPHSMVLDRAQVGAGSVLHARVTVGQDCILGQRCILHPGAVIGADGFGFAPDEGRWEKIEQLGAVRIGDDVEIGANTCIDRGTLDDTVIENGVKLDNLIQIAHNVHVGAHSAFAACVGVAGSARIGRHCTVGGAAVVLGHLELADHVHISAASVVMRSIDKPGHYSGIFPIDDNAAWEKNAATLKQLHALRGRVKELEKKL